MANLVRGEKVLMWVSLWVLAVAANLLNGRPIGTENMLLILIGGPVLVAYVARLWGAGKARAELAEAEAYGDHTAKEDDILREYINSGEYVDYHEENF